MSNSKFNCGQIIPSSCVPYTGKDLTFLLPEDQLECDANINDAIFEIDKQIKILVDGNNLTGLDKECFDFDPATVTPAQLHQLEITKICSNEGSIAALTTQFNNLDIGIEVVTIDLPDCLEPLAAPCLVGTNQYQLITLLNLFAAKLCDHETRIAELESIVDTPDSGSDAAGLNSYAYFWQSVSDVSGTIASNNAKVLFENSASNNTPDITIVPGSGNITIGAGATGLYKISWMVAGAEPNAFAVFKGNTKQLGSVYGSGAGTQQNSGFTLISLTAGDIISLRTDNAPAAITLQLAGTTDVDQIVASIIFEKFN